MSQRITIEYDIDEFRGRMTVDASGFSGLSASEIEKAIREDVIEHARANVGFYPTNTDKAVREIQAALEAERLEDEEALS